MKKLLFLIIAGGLVYLNYTNPQRADHEALLLAELRKNGPVSEEQFASVMKDVDFSNFMVCSATKTSVDSRIITYGYLKKTKLVNDQWLKQAGQKAPANQPILEVNAQHALVKRLERDEAHFDDLAHLLFDQAWLAEGGQLDDPAAHVQRVTRLLTAS